MPTENGSSTFGLDHDVVDAMSHVFAAYPEVEQVILYGSRAKGNFRPGSDIDLCLVGRELTLQSLLKIDTELDDLLLPYKIDLSIHAHIDNPALLAHIQRAGMAVYRR